MGVVVHIISVRHAALETKTKMLLQSLLFGLLVNTISSVPAPGHFFHHGYHGYHGYHPKCTTELEAVTKTLCRIEVEKECETKTKTYTKITGYEDTDCREVEFKAPVHHGYGYGYHKREAEADADAHGYAYEKVTKTICKKTPITEEVSKDFELCRPKPSEVCEDKEVKVPKLVCEEPVEKEAADVETI